jgi:hypothetical protein
MNRVLPLVVMVMVLGAGVVPAAVAQEATPTAGAPAALDRTNIRYFLPFTGDGLNAELTVTANERGSCAHESLAAPGRPDAWHCIGETSNEIFDPCFESPFATPDEPGELACADSPFVREVVLFAPTGPLPRFKEPEAGQVPASAGVAVPVPAAPLPPRPGADKPPPGAPPVVTIPERPMPVGAPTPVEPEPLPWAMELGNGERCTLATGVTAVFAGMRVNYFCLGGGSVLGDPDRTLPVWAVTYLPDGAFASELVDVATVWH